MAKIAPISGFPEWLPEEKLAEDRLISQIKAIYQSHGFVPIETPAVELIDTLTAKGLVEREIYSVKRFHAEDETESSLGLHFDLTVPFARYTAQHFGKLVFPFKRYQMQKVWRGERPQKGRFREFCQFDIDTIAREELPLSCDAEILTVILKAFHAMNIGPFVMMLNSRKILHGCYASLGLSEEVRKKAITAVDKLNKIGPDGVTKELVSEAGLDSETAAKILKLTSVKVGPAELRSTMTALGIKDERFAEGVAELEMIASLIPTEYHSYIEVDLSLARGLDYYTGVVYEVQLKDHREFGTVSSGGRYEDLASQFTNQKLPGVGGSIGLTRLMDLLLSKKLVSTEQKTAVQVLVTVLSEEQRGEANRVAEELRRVGVATEVYFKSPKLGKQIEFADTKGIPYTLFLAEAGGAIQVKSLKTKEQISVTDIAQWGSALLKSGM